VTTAFDSPEAVIARRAAAELSAGDVVNLGVGIPLELLAYVDPEAGVVLHSENGIVGMGPRPPANEIDVDLADATAQPVTVMPGASYLSLLDSGAVMRGGHLDKVVMGAFQVDSRGGLANTMLSTTDIKGGIGGAMDLAVGAGRLIVVMRHTTKDGRPRLVRECSLPLTAAGVVNTVITELAVVDLDARGFVLRELLGGATLHEVEEGMDAPLYDGRDRPRKEEQSS
jgi:3-oxoacid CoA-transferase B subunit